MLDRRAPSRSAGLVSRRGSFHTTASGVEVRCGRAGAGWCVDAGYWVMDSYGVL